MALLTVSNLSSPLAGPFNFTVESGCCMAVTGASGSGKSLMLRMIADLDPNEGRVSLDSLDRAACSAPDWRGRVTYIAAEAGWWAETVAEHFAAPQLAPAKVLADRLGLKPELFAGLVSRLSTGEKQRLSLIRGLVRQPPALLLDEPTSALDRDSVAQVEVILRERLGAGLALVLVTHDPGQAERLGDHRYEMRHGQLAKL